MEPTKKSNRPFNREERELGLDTQNVYKARLRALKNLFWSFLGVLLCLLIWEIIAFNVSNDAFPEFFKSLGAMFSLFSEPNTMVSLGYSLYRIVITLVIVTILGWVLGLLSSYIEPLEKILSPLMYLLTSFPTASMIFILIIYTKITSYLLVGFLTFPLIYKASLTGGKQIKEKYQDPMSLEGKYSFNNFTKVICPLSLPYLFMGLAQATGLALKGEIMAEVFMSSNSFKGIGKEISIAFNNVDTLRMFALTLLALLVMGLFELVLALIKRELNKRYGTKPIKVYHFNLFNQK